VHVFGRSYVVDAVQITILGEMSEASQRDPTGVAVAVISGLRHAGIPGRVSFSTTGDIWGSSRERLAIIGGGK
jgi:hypothetical protein